MKYNPLSSALSNKISVMLNNEKELRSLGSSGHPSAELGRKNKEEAV